MKIRSGFISNSSSTSFMFIFKGQTKEDLYDAIWKNRKDFHLVTDDNRSCCAEWLVDEIESLPDNIIREGSDPINLLIKTRKCILNDNKKYLADSKDKYFSESWRTIVEDEEQLIKRLQNLKDKGFTWSMIISFGDNHGDISGGNVGTAMDYESYHFKDYEKEDLAIITINEH